jgi:hypothetical protein
MKTYNAIDKVNKLRVKTKILWEKKCKYDNIDPSEKFIVFSDNNPYSKKYDKIIGEYMKLVNLINCTIYGTGEKNYWNYTFLVSIRWVVNTTYWNCFINYTLHYKEINLKRMVF